MKIKVLEKVSIITSLLLIIFINSYAIYYKDTLSSIIGFTLVLIINPIKIIYRRKVKIIHNLIFHILNIILSLLMIYIYVLTTKEVLLTSNIGNQYYYILGMFFGFILLNIIGLFIKKEERIRKKDIFNYGLILILLFTIISYKNVYTIIHSFSFLGSLIILLLTFINYNRLITRNELQKKLFILMLFSLINYNFISIFILINLYIDIDYFGLNI